MLQAENSFQFFGRKAGEKKEKHKGREIAVERWATPTLAVGLNKKSFVSIKLNMCGRKNKKNRKEGEGFVRCWTPFVGFFVGLPLQCRMDYPMDYPVQHDCVLVAISLPLSPASWKGNKMVCTHVQCVLEIARGGKSTSTHYIFL